MDDDKKKKKKNKNANRPVENVTVDERDLNPGVVSQSGQDSDSQVSVNIDADWDWHNANGTAKELPKNEEQIWLDREVLLDARINQLLKENDEYRKKETTQREEIQQLYDEKNASIEREVDLNENIIKLNREKDALMLKQGLLEQTIRKLHMEIDVHLQKSNSDKESIVGLTNRNTILQEQVIELEHSRDSLIEENEQLTGIITSLELQIKFIEGSDGSQNMTSEDVDLDHKIEATDAIIQKSIPESSEYTEKVHGEVNVVRVGSVQVADIDNDIHEGSVLVHDPAVGGHDNQISDQMVKMIPEDTKMVPFSSSAQSLEDILLEDEGIKHLNDIFGKSLEIQEVDDENVVPVPFNEGEAQKSTWEADEITEVPLIDAPLIGAPFRFISFFTRYVSGADLVANTGQKPG